MAAAPGEASALVRERVLAARTVQLERGWLNAQIPAPLLREHCAGRLGPATGGRRRGPRRHERTRGAPRAASGPHDRRPRRRAARGRATAGRGAAVSGVGDAASARRIGIDSGISGRACWTTCERSCGTTTRLSPSQTDACECASLGHPPARDPGPLFWQAGTSHSTRELLPTASSVAYTPSPRSTHVNSSPPPPTAGSPR